MKALSRELQRNTGDNGYCAETAHSFAIERRKSARKHSKTDERQMPIIEKGLLLGWSPENISCRMKLEIPEIALSHKSRYTLIDKVDTKQAETVADSMIKLLGRVYHTG